MIDVAPKPLPALHKHLLTAKAPMIVCKPSHRVHKTLKLEGGCNRGAIPPGQGGKQINIKGRRKSKKDDVVHQHPYKHAAEIA